MALESFTIASERTYLIRIVEKGDHYGLRDGLTSNSTEPLIEFYDHDVDHQKFVEVQGESGERGQFVSRYYVGTLVRHLLDHPGAGLDLDGSFPEWVISPADVRRAVDMGLQVWTGRKQY